MSIDLARRKEDQASGGNVNYYLVVIPGKGGAADVVVEIEDIIEFCDMLFHAGCVFKAIVRLCKLRMDLGKPGSTKKYEAEKSLYYSSRTIAVTNRRLSAMTLLLKPIRFFNNLRLKSYFADPKQIVIHIPDPKRLEPYTFVLGDFIKALEPTSNEARVLEGILTVSLMRKMSWLPLLEEASWAKITHDCAKSIEQREKTAHLVASSTVLGCL